MSKSKLSQINSFRNSRNTARLLFRRVPASFLIFPGFSVLNLLVFVNFLKATTTNSTNYSRQKVILYQTFVLLLSRISPCLSFTLKFFFVCFHHFLILLSFALFNFFFLSDRTRRSWQSRVYGSCRTTASWTSPCPPSSGASPSSYRQTFSKLQYKYMKTNIWS
jgi:hypothetical protein